MAGRRDIGATRRERGLESAKIIPEPVASELQRPVLSLS